MNTIVVYCKDCGAMFYANARPTVDDVIDIIGYYKEGHRIIVVDAAIVRVELATCICALGKKEAE